MIYRRRIRGVIKGQGNDARLVKEMTGYTASAGREYQDERGRTCREVTVPHRSDGKWISTQAIFCLERGKWVDTQLGK